MNPLNTFRQLTFPQRLSLVIVAVVSILIFVYYRVTPYYADDLNFGKYWPAYITQGDTAFDWTIFYEWILMQIAVDSPRFFNLLLPVFAYLPKWIFDALIAMAAGSSIILAARCSGLSLRHPLRIAIITAAIILFFPWEDGMTCMAYSLNYLFSSLVGLLFIQAFDAADDEKNCYLMLIGTLAGWSHETLGTSLIAGTTLWMAINHRAVSKKLLYLSLPLIIVTLVLLATMTFGRYSHKLFFTLNYLYKDANDIYIVVYELLTKYNLVILSVSLLFIALAIKRFRGKIKPMLSGTFPIVFTAMLVLTVEGIILDNIGLRVTWFPQLFGLLSSSMLINRMFPAPFIKNRLYATSLAILILSIVSCNLIAGTIATKRQADQLDAICDLYLEKSSEGQFREMSAFVNMTPLAFNRIPLAVLRRQGITWVSFLEFYSDSDKSYPVPLSLKNLHDVDLTKIPGDNPFYRHSSGWVVRVQSPDNDNESYVITPDWGVRQEASYEYVPFISSDGRHWEVTYNTRTDIQSRWAGIRRIDRRK